MNPVSSNQRDWDEHIDLIMLAYRSSIHSSSGFTPSMLHIGRDIRLPVDLIFGTPITEQTEKDKNITSYTVNLEKKLLLVHELARKNMEMASKSMKANYDVNLKYNVYSEGDAVWYYCPKRKCGISPKLQRPWLGPCKIVKKINDVLYRIQIKPHSKPKIVHHDKLKVYTGKDTPEWF